jgi:hypothetical protein
MSIEKLLNFVVESVRRDEAYKAEKAREIEVPNRPVPPSAFWSDVPAGRLIEPSRKNGEYHREREKWWTNKLEDAEIKLKEEGVSIQVYDSAAGTYDYSNICSGAITGGATQNFQPRVDQKMLDNVKNAKSKMLEHRGKAEQYEKYARAFAVGPDRLIRLTVEDIHYFRLEG